MAYDGPAFSRKTNWDGMAYDLSIFREDNIGMDGWNFFLFAVSSSSLFCST